MQRLKYMGVDHIVFVYNFLSIGRDVNEMIDTSKQLSKLARWNFPMLCFDYTKV